MNNEMISVIVPVYNANDFLERTVSSIINQSYKNIEILLVDNGSTDGSSEFVELLAQKYDKVFALHEERHGVTYARIAGVKNAKGEWIGFVDSDDEIEPEMYQILYNNVKKNQAQISHCGYQMIFQNHTNYFYNTNQLLVQDNFTGLKDLLEGILIEPGLWNKLYHKSLFNDAFYEYTDYSIKNNEDLLMNFLLFKNSSKSVFYDFCPYHYIVRDNSASRGDLSDNKIFDPIKVKELIVAISPKELVSRAQAAYIGTCVDAYNTLITNRKRKKDEIEVKMLIEKHKDWIPLTRKNAKIMLFGIRYCGFIYKVLYRIYAKHIQRSKYA